TIEAVQVADQPLNASMLGPLQKVPVEGMVVAPFILLCKLVAHEKQFLPGKPEHETEIGAQIGEALPLISRHSSEERLLAVHHLIMRKRKNEILKESIVQAEQNLSVMMLAVDRVLADVI